MNVPHETKRTFLGTGLIGAGLAEAALGRGESATVWNRTQSKAEALVAMGARVAPSARAAVEGASRVHVALTSDDACDAVLEEVASALSPNAIVLDHSTTAPKRTAARASRLREAGVRYLHAPVFMSPEACRAAKGVMMVAGPRDLFEEVERDLACMTGQVMYVGEASDRAAATKLVGNGMILAMLGGLSDIFAVGRDHGVDAASVLALFERFDVRSVLTGRGARMAEGDFDTLWTLKMARKDLGLMMDAASTPLTVLPAIAARADALIADGDGDLDVGVIARDSLGKNPS